MYPAPLQNLIDELNKMPSIGQKSAIRLAFYIMNLTQERAGKLMAAIAGAREQICLCESCQNLTEVTPCPICASEKRDHSVICVIESPKDLVAMEKTREFSGLYHVLHGAISPLDGVAPGDLKIKELLARMTDAVKEVILATNPTVEGEATAMYLARLIKPLGIKVTRLAHGIPVGGDIEFADEVTLSRALEGRREV